MMHLAELTIACAAAALHFHLCDKCMHIRQQQPNCIILHCLKSWLHGLAPDSRASPTCHLVLSPPQSAALCTGHLNQFLMCTH